MINDIEKEVILPQDETLSEMIDHSSGSGSGLPLLVNMFTHFCHILIICRVWHEFYFI